MYFPFGAKTLCKSNSLTDDFPHSSSACSHLVAEKRFMLFVSKHLFVPEKPFTKSVVFSGVHLLFC
jgi:hypothetical protein